jgi:hypothetical protein
MPFAAAMRDGRSVKNGLRAAMLALALPAAAAMADTYQAAGDPALNLD